MSKSVLAIQNNLNGVVDIELKTKVNERLLGNYTNIAVGSSMRIHQLDNGQYEMYPKIWFFGDSTKDNTQHRLFADLTMNDLKDIIDAFLKSNNARNIVWYIDYTSGEQKIIDFTSIR